MLSFIHSSQQSFLYDQPLKTQYVYINIVNMVVNGIHDALVHIEQFFLVSEWLS